MKNPYPIIGAGSYLENLLTETINYYASQEIILIWKNDPKYVINDVANLNTFSAIRPQGCDYSGIWKGTFIEFEVKSTTTAAFRLSMLSNYQLKRLALINSYGGVTFIIIYFAAIEKYFAISFPLINTAIKKRKTSLSVEWCKEKGYELFIQHPLHLSLVSYLSN